MLQSIKQQTGILFNIIEQQAAAGFDTDMLEASYNSMQHTADMLEMAINSHVSLLNRSGVHGMCFLNETTWKNN